MVIELWKSSFQRQIQIKNCKSSSNRKETISLTNEYSDQCGQSVTKVVSSYFLSLWVLTPLFSFHSQYLMRAHCFRTSSFLASRLREAEFLKHTCRSVPKKLQNYKHHHHTKLVCDLYSSLSYMKILFFICKATSTVVDCI